MPGLPNKMNQPRQPHNLQGLLRYAIDTVQYSDEEEPQRSDHRSPQLIDEERRNFLQNALTSMTVNVTKLMKEQIALLNVPDVLDGDLREKLHAFDLFADYVDEIDLAIDFHKINGFSVFEPCFSCQNTQIRASACNLLAELAQNNPYIQNVICECTTYMTRLLTFVENDPEEVVQIKALYAISCITRDSEFGYTTFKANNGMKVLKKALNKESLKLRTKIAFFLTSLCTSDAGLADTLIEQGYLPLLMELADGEWNSSHEHILSLLNLLVETSPTVRTLLQSPEYQLKEIIDGHLEFVRGKEEFKEEEQYCDAILKAVFP